MTNKNNETSLYTKTLSANIVQTENGESWPFSPPIELDGLNYIFQLDFINSSEGCQGNGTLPFYSMFPYTAILKSSREQKAIIDIVIIG